MSQTIGNSRPLPLHLFLQADAPLRSFPPCRCIHLPKIHHSLFLLAMESLCDSTRQKGNQSPRLFHCRIEFVDGPHRLPIQPTSQILPIRLHSRPTFLRFHFLLLQKSCLFPPGPRLPIHSFHVSTLDPIPRPHPGVSFSLLLVAAGTVASPVEIEGQRNHAQF